MAGVRGIGWRLVPAGAAETLRGTQGFLGTLQRAILGLLSADCFGVSSGCFITLGRGPLFSCHRGGDLGSERLLLSTHMASEA